MVLVYTSVKIGEASACNLMGQTNANKGWWTSYDCECVGFSKGCMGLLYCKECNMNDHLIAPPSMGIKCHKSLVLNLPELAIFRRNASNIHTSHFSACSMPKSTTIIQRNNSSYMQSPNFSFFSAIHVLMGRLSNSISFFRKNMHLKKTLMCFQSHIWNYMYHKKSTVHVDISPMDPMGIDNGNHEVGPSAWSFKRMRFLVAWGAIYLQELGYLEIYEVWLHRLIDSIRIYTL